MPVTSHVSFLVGDHHEVERAGGDGVATSRADVFLHRLIGLDRSDRYQPKIAHAMTASVMSRAKTTTAMSRALFSCSRNGLKPT